MTTQETWNINSELNITNYRYMSVAPSPNYINVVRNWEVSCMLFSLHLGWASLLPAEHEFPTWLVFLTLDFKCFFFPKKPTPWLYGLVCPCDLRFAPGVLGPHPWDLGTLGAVARGSCWHVAVRSRCVADFIPSAEWKSVSMIKTVGVLLDWFSMIFLQTNGMNLWGMDSRSGHTANLLPGKAWRRPSFDWPA